MHGDTRLIMSVSSSVRSIIKRHMKPVTSKRVSKSKTTPVFQALATTLQPTTSTSTALNGKREASLSVNGALARYPRIPSIAMAAAHRLLAEQAAEPSSSSQVTYLLHRQRLYERLARIFVSHPSTERVTVPSLFQRMVDEGIPPNLDTLKIVLSTAGRHDIPILHILRNVLDMDGLPDKVDTHLLGLVMKALVREGGMKPDDLERMLEECTTAGILGKEDRPIVFDELLVEAYGQAGDMRGMLDVLSRHRYRYRARSGTSSKRESPNPEPGSRGVLSLYLQAIRQWISNPSIRRKRRGSLFPRILAKDLVELYGGYENLPTPWLNSWMNAERIANDTEAAMTVWQLIGPRADHVSYATYFRLSKQLLSSPTANLRATVSDLVAYQNRMESGSIETVEAGLSAAFQHDDLPLALFLARQIVAKNTKAVIQLKPTERTIDILAAGLVRAWRRGGLEGTMGQSPIIGISTIIPISTDTRTNGPSGSGRGRGSGRGSPEYIVRDEWDIISTRLGDPSLALPLSRPLARLSTQSQSQSQRASKSNIDSESNNGGNDEITVMTFHPTPSTNGMDSKSKFRSGKLGRGLDSLMRVLEEAIVERSMDTGSTGSANEILARTMQDLHREVLPTK